MVTALVAACAVVGGAAAWHASKPAAEASPSVERQRLNERLQRGVGGEVRFASTNSRHEQVEEAVASAADFIYRRSGLKMSDETRCVPRCAR